MGEGAIFTAVSSVVRHGFNYPYLADRVVQRMFPNHEEKDEAQSLKSVSREVLEGHWFTLEPLDKNFLQFPQLKKTLVQRLQGEPL